MSAFLYFLPDVTREQFCRNIRQATSKAGIDDVLSDCGVDELGMTNVNHGPGGKHGTIVVPLPVDRARRWEQRYLPQEQEWEQTSDHLWLGLQKDSRPEPDDLRRQRLHSGYQIELGDGNAWQVPIVRRPDYAVDRFQLGSTELPRDFLWRNGQLEQPIQSAYEQLWRDSAEISDQFFTPEGVLSEMLHCDAAWALEKCVQVLSVNYRIGMAEQNAMRLINSENWSSLLGCACDVPTVDALIRESNAATKKTAGQSVPAGVSGSNGHADAIEDTARAEATCT